MIFIIAKAEYHKPWRSGLGITKVEAATEAEALHLWFKDYMGQDCYAEWLSEFDDEYTPDSWSEDNWQETISDKFELFIEIVKMEDIPRLTNNT